METNPFLRIWRALPGAVPLHATAAHPGADLPRLRRQLLCMVCFLPPLLYLNGQLFGLPLPDFLWNRPFVCGLLQLVFCLPVLAAGRSIFLSGWTSLRRAAPDGHTLSALACGLLLAQGLGLLVRLFLAQGGEALALQAQLPFCALALVLTLLTLLALADGYCRLRAFSHLHALLQLPPATATLVRDGQSLPVATSEAAFGDSFLVRPGERFPLDGVVLDGRSPVSEFVLTGDRTPVEKQPGAPVYAGTKNLGSALICRVTAAGPSTALRRLVQQVEKSAAGGLPSGPVATACIRFFTPLVFVLALAVTLFFCFTGHSFDWALLRGVSILLVASPAALALAVPISLLAESCLGVKNGILFPRAAGMSAVSRLDTLVLDTTGVLTLGRPQVTKLLPCENVSLDFLLSLAAGLEASSQRPTALAVLEKARTEKLTINPVATVMETPGCGMRGFVVGKEARGGTAAYVGSVCTLPASLEQEGRRMEEAHITPLYYCLAGHAAGLVGVAADAVRPTAAYTVAQLQSMGLRVLLLPGRLSCDLQEIAAQVGADDVLADAPQDALQALKSTCVPGLVLHGSAPEDMDCCCLVVGASLSALPSHADAVLLTDSPQGLSAAISLSRHALRLLRVSRSWAVLYNLVGMLLVSGLFAGLGFAPGPVAAVALSALSTPVLWQHAWRCTRTLPQAPTRPDAEAADSSRIGGN